MSSRPLSNHPRGARLLARSERAASEVVGSVLLVAITVISAAGFGALLFAYEGPEPANNTRLGVSIVPSANGWGTGSEEIRVEHLGGKTLRAGDTTIRYTLSGTRTVLSGNELGSAFADGGLTIGERWTRTVLANLNDAVDLEVLVGGAAGELLTSTRVLAGVQAGSTCLSDTSPPSGGTWTQNPSDVNSLSNGSVTVTVTLADGCSGVDGSITPSLLWCLAATCTVPTSFTNAGAMTSVGTNRWSGLIPHTGAWTADAIAGRALQYYVSPVTDLNGNTGQTATRVDVIDLIATYQYVASSSVVKGSVANLTYAQSPSDSNAAATITEAAVAGAPGTGGPTQLSGTSVAHAGATSASDALASDDARAQLALTNSLLEVSGFDVPSSATGITAVTIGFEGRKSGNGGSDPTVRLDYKVGSGTYDLGTASSVTNAVNDNDHTRTLAGTFSVADVEAMTVRLYHVLDTNRDVEVDRIFVTVTYTTAAVANYATDVNLEWSGVTNGTTISVELRYRVDSPGDSFVVQISTGSGWRTCSGSLTATTLTTYSCVLQLPGEYANGAPVVRITDSSPTGTTQGRLYLDYARMATA